MPAYSLIPPTPDSSGHHGNKPLLSSRKTTAVATMATSAGGQRSEVARQISYLLSPSSPLVGENLKVSAPSERATNHLSPHLTVLSLAAQVLLGAVAFGALSAGQRQQLMSLLPAVDRQHPSKCPHCLHVLSPHTLHQCLLSPFSAAYYPLPWVTRSLAVPVVSGRIIWPSVSMAMEVGVAGETRKVVTMTSGGRTTSLSLSGERGQP